VDGKVGYRVSLESERTGRGPREGEIVEVIGSGDGVGYRVRLDDGHESTFFPSGGSVTITPRVATKSRKKT
jgi:hypothetical protein